MSGSMGYDVIGDVHGELAKLEALLEALGYVRGEAGWVPPAGRMAVFVGDLIDRGPEQVAVIRLVRSLVERGHAHCILGNHEFNAIGWLDGLAERSDSKRLHHAAFLEQVGEDSALHHEIIDWLRSLPLFLDLGGLRVVHACWDPASIERIAAVYWDGARISDAFLREAFRKGSDLWHAVDRVAKGVEVRLPGDAHFLCHAGIARKNVRVRWWLDAADSLRDIALVPAGQEERVPALPVPAEALPGVPDGSPVFIGHYWMQGRPQLLGPRLACLDWAVAADGPAVAYRWDGECELQEHKLVAAGA